MPHTPHTVETALITPSQEGLPVSVVYDDFYFSTDNALEEKHHVFIHNNNLPSRFAALAPNQTYTLCELGFGTGLNFLLTVQAWLDARKTASTTVNSDSDATHPPAYLRFISIEQHPLSLEQLQQACALWPALSEISQTLMDAYPAIQTPGFHHLSFEHFHVELTLIFDHVEHALLALSPCPLMTTEHAQTYTKHQQREERKGHLLPHFDDAIKEINNTQCSIGRAQQGIDGWFFDGFSPAKNPDMWQANIFTLAARLSHKRTHYATFTAASFVRKHLQQAGFSVEKTVGYGKKREMIKGVFLGLNLRPNLGLNEKSEQHHAAQPTPNAVGNMNTHAATNLLSAMVSSANASHANTASYRKKNSAIHFWHLQKSHATPRPKHVCIIGAGIAGAHMAFALAQKNIRVTVYDKANQIAAGASGNAQGVVYTKLSPKDDHLSVFNIAAQLHADRFYHQHGLYRQCGEGGGVVHLATNEKTQENYQALAKKLHSPYVQWHDDPSELAGIALHKGGLVLPKSGWLNPQRLCRALLDHKNITVTLNQAITQLTKTEQQQAQQWALYNKDTLIDTACNVVISSAYEATQFEQTRHSACKAIRGQVTHLRPTPHTANLKMAVCGYGYIAPVQDGLHCAGATFNLNTPDLTPNPHDDATNIANLLRMSEKFDFESADIAALSRAAFRTATPDYFPIVGSAVDQASFNRTFNEYRERGNAFIAQTASHHQGLYLNMGYGSRGLAYAPLCTAMLCKQITGEPLTTPIQTAIQLHPSRFLFRELVKGKAPKKSHRNAHSKSHSA